MQGTKRGMKPSEQPAVPWYNQETVKNVSFEQKDCRNK